MEFYLRFTGILFSSAEKKWALMPNWTSLSTDLQGLTLLAAEAEMLAVIGLVII